MVVVRWFVALFGFLFVLSFLGSIGKADDQCNDEVSAVSVAKDFVLARLKAPATAAFGPYDSFRATSMGDCRWMVTGYVDAENSFGAKLRMPFSSMVQYQAETKKWRLEDVVFDEM